jgi:uncharacterized membrane protein YcaP (DUF421 family)
MDDSGPAFLAAVAVRTAIVFAAVVAGVRATGKRQTGEMNSRDLLLALMLANAVQNAMTKGDGSLGVALTAAGTLVLLGWAYAKLTGRRPGWEPGLAGVPTVLVQDGRPVRRALRREGISNRDLMAAVRDQGLAGLADVRLAVLEIDGEISVVPRDRPKGG